MLAVDAVVERGQRLDLVRVGALVELDDALQHDLDRLADPHHLARGVGQRLAGVSSALLVERADSSVDGERVGRLGRRAKRHDLLGSAIDEAGQRQAGKQDDAR